MGTYVASWQFAPRFRAANIKREQAGGGMNWPEDVRPIVKDHLDYLKGLHKEGKVIIGGPMAAFDWALVICRTDTMDETIDLLSADPAYKAGLLTDLKVEPWHRAVK